MLCWGRGVDLPWWQCGMSCINAISFCVLMFFSHFFLILHILLPVYRQFNHCMSKGVAKLDMRGLNCHPCSFFYIFGPSTELVSAVHLHVFLKQPLPHYGEVKISVLVHTCATWRPTFRGGAKTILRVFRWIRQCGIFHPVIGNFFCFL